MNGHFFISLDIKVFNKNIITGMNTAPSLVTSASFKDTELRQKLVTRKQNLTGGAEWKN